MWDTEFLKISSISHPTSANLDYLVFAHLLPSVSTYCAKYLVLEIDTDVLLI